MINVPNILTFIRLLLVIPCGIFLYKEQYQFAAIVFFVASVTDIIDGYIARKFNLITNIGKIIDPLADKILSFTTITLLAYRGRIHLIIPILIFVKEVMIAIGGLVMYKKKQLIKGASWYGKVATVMFFVSIMLVMFNKTLFIGSILIIVALVFSYFALAMYLRMLIKVLRVNKLSEQIPL